MYPAFTGALPQVQKGVGPVLASPRFVPVFFSNDDTTARTGLTDFVSKLGGTQYWAATTAEYGVGAATSTAPVVLTEAAPTTIDDADIQTWLLGKLDAGDPLWPTADANTVYVLHYPAGTTVTKEGVSGCAPGGFGGYHKSITLDAAHASLPVAYAVLPRCSTSAGVALAGPGSVTPFTYTGVDAVTSVESHELVEAATDPSPSATAYSGLDAAHGYWARALGGDEVADLCALPYSSFTKFAELPHAVQRSWSNEAAATFQDPCVPAIPGAVYFAAMPVLPDTITTQFGRIPGVTIPVGMSRTIDLELVSDAATSGPWTVAAKDVNELYTGTASLDLSLDQTTGVNGDKLHLTITVVTASPDQTESFLVVSKLNGVESLWAGIVGN
jgi:hypothetical protein